MRAWEMWSETEDWENARRWALHEEHVDGSLWEAFRAAYDAALIEAAGIAKRECMVRAKAEKMGAHLHDPDGSLMGYRIAGSIISLCSLEAWKVK